MIWSDFGQLTGAILLMVGALLPVVNPLGDAPIFLRMTPGCDESTRADLAKRIAFYSFILLLTAMLLGSFVLRLFGLSIPLVQVAGGAVVCALGWKLLSAEAPKPADATIDPAHAKLIAFGHAFAPLTMPLTIDAGVISVAITVGANHAHTFQHAMIQLLAAFIGTGIIALSILLTYRYAQRVGKRIGLTGMMVVVRLSAFIMLCIGVGITWNGVKALLAEIGIPG
ncbi:MAG: MarC family protein [Verrucomicrobiota bacterium]|jgi:multiple antibiotic resistance protein